MRGVRLLLLALVAGCGASRSGSGLGSGGAGGAFADLAGAPPAGDSAGAALGGSESEAGAGGQIAPGEAGTAGTAGETDGGAAGCVAVCAVRPPAGLVLDRIAFFQATKVPIMEQMLEVTNRRAQVVSGRAGLFRVYVSPSAEFQVRSMRAHLTIQPLTGDALGFDETKVVSVASTDAALSSTFNIEVPADLVSEGLSYSLELFEANPTAGGTAPTTGIRFPASGEQPLGVKAASRLRVELVPVQFDVGQMSLSPDVSPEQVARFRRQVMSWFPISGIDITVRDQPLHTTSTDLVAVLDQVAALRDTENDDPDLSYFGVVRFTDSITQYCNPSCVLGASFTGSVPTGGVGVGVDYTGDKAAFTFAHELGHVHGRSHTPCGVAGDASYPYSGGRIGEWGYDVPSKALFDPNNYSDFMGYCAPAWVSDFTYEHLRQFIAAMPTPIAAGSASARSLPTHSAGTGRVRALLLQAGQAPRWGLARPARGAQQGEMEQATTYDATGSVVGTVSVHRARAADLGLEVVYVPEPAAPTWVSVRVTGQPPVLFPTGAHLPTSPL